MNLKQKIDQNTNNLHYEVEHELNDRQNYQVQKCKVHLEDPIFVNSKVAIDVAFPFFFPNYHLIFHDGSAIPNYGPAPPIPNHIKTTA